MTNDRQRLMKSSKIIIWCLKLTCNEHGTEVNKLWFYSNDNKRSNSYLWQKNSYIAIAIAIAIAIDIAIAIAIAIAI